MWSLEDVVVSTSTMCLTPLASVLGKCDLNAQWGAGRGHDPASISDQPRGVHASTPASSSSQLAGNFSSTTTPRVRARYRDCAARPAADRSHAGSTRGQSRPQRRLHGRGAHEAKEAHEGTRAPVSHKDEFDESSWTPRATAPAAAARPGFSGGQRAEKTSPLYFSRGERLSPSIPGP